MADLAYRRLIDHYFLHEKPIAEDVSAAAEDIGMTEEIVDVEKVLKKFFTLDPGRGWINKRCEEEIARVTKAGDTARENGKKGGRKPGTKGSKPKSNPEKTQSVVSGFDLGTQSGGPGPAQDQATRDPLPITRNPLHSVSYETGAGAPAGHDPMVPPPEERWGEGIPMEMDDRGDRMPTYGMTDEQLANLRTGKPAPEVIPPAAPPSAKPAAKERATVPGQDYVFSTGLDLLVNHGTPVSKARENLGKWFFKSRDRQIVIDAIDAAIQAQAEDPFTYISKICSEANKGRGHKPYAGDLKGMDYDAPSRFSDGSQLLDGGND